MKLKVQREHKKREGKVERDTARVFYMRLSQVRLKIQFNLLREILGGGEVGWRVALSPLENGDRERWPSRPGYSQLGGVGQVEPDK